MTGDEARRERTLPAGLSLAPGREGTDDPPVVFELPPAGSNENVRDEDFSGDEGSQGGDEPTARTNDGPARQRQGGRAGGVLRPVLKVAIWATALPALCVLSIVLALHISITTYQGNGYDAGVALSLGALAALLVICVCTAAFMYSFQIHRRFFMHFFNAWLALILCYSGYALFHLAHANAKTEEVRDYYTSLHPLLRVAVKNLSLVDEQLVITDLHRTPDDYKAMGLRRQERSMHFRQSTGFVHAVDVRTNGRSQIKNLLVELYFVLMGFDTLRHVGTADHLHVSLPLRDADT